MAYCRSFLISFFIVHCHLDGGCMRRAHRLIIISKAKGEGQIRRWLAVVAPTQSTTHAVNPIPENQKSLQCCTNYVHKKAHPAVIYSATN